MDPLPHAFHMLLQSIADVTMLLPLGSAVQQMAIRCFCLKFRQSDHQFLHESHVFSNISQILSKSDELMEQGNGELPKVRIKLSLLLVKSCMAYMYAKVSCSFNISKFIDI